MSAIKHSSIAARLYDANSIDEKFSILEKVATDAGFDGVLYTFVPKLSRLSEVLQPVFQYSDSYIPIVENYQKNRFDKNDFTIRLIEKGQLDVIDWWEAAKKMTLSKEEEHVNNVTKNDFGVMKGITFPTLGSSVGIAGVSVISFNKEHEGIEVDAQIIETLQRCARIYHDHMMVHQDDRYSFILPLLDSLSPKKKIVIKHLISGQPMKKIEALGVTERYGEKLLLELRKSFGDITKNELIYLLGLLNISEYL